jgi:hypothetical protein
MREFTATPYLPTSTKHHSHVGDALPWWVEVHGRLSAHTPRYKIPTPEGFLSTLGCPRALTHKPILVLCPWPHLLRTL